MSKTLQWQSTAFKYIRSLVLGLPIHSFFLVPCSGMAEELQHLPGANSACSTAGWLEGHCQFINSIIILLWKVIIFSICRNLSDRWERLRVDLNKIITNVKNVCKTLNILYLSKVWTHLLIQGLFVIFTLF